MNDSLWISTSRPSVENYQVIVWDFVGFFIDLIFIQINGSQLSLKQTLPSIEKKKKQFSFFMIYLLWTKFKGKAGIVKTKILNDRQQILTKDDMDNVQLWNIFKHDLFQSFGNIDFEEKANQMSQQISLPNWFSVDTTTGVWKKKQDHK